ncbi:hypothetical protein HMPREF3156_02091 [Neisseria sp. HMSC06F02]|nr:hypothetical protein HMPREF3156_02091 [Neisseria sp. HMSC06F02]
MRVGQFISNSKFLYAKSGRRNAIANLSAERFPIQFKISVQAARRFFIPQYLAAIFCPQ